MLKTKDKDFYQILVDSNNHNTLHTKYGAGRSYNEVITEILDDFESALSIINECEGCGRSLSKQFLQMNNTNKKGSRGTNPITPVKRFNSPIFNDPQRNQGGADNEWIME